MPENAQAQIHKSTTMPALSHHKFLPVRLVQEPVYRNCRVRML